MGKTSFVMNIAISVAKSDKTVAVFSLEMSNAQLFERIIGTECCIPVPRLRVCDIKSSEWKLISKKCEELSPLDIFIDDAPDLSILDIKNRCKRIKKINGLDLIIVDYLQLIRANKNLVREQQVTEISHGLKALAKELNVPVIATAQLNRQVENGENKRPHLSSIRESGSVEQDADMIIGLYRDELYNENSPDKGLAEVIIIKNRSGSLGNIKLGFEKEYVKFKNM
jgi:replicative DNA helicase